MGHEIAKDLLDRAGSVPERAAAVRKAVSLGMPLHEIEAYLDHLDANPRLSKQFAGHIAAQAAQPSADRTDNDHVVPRRNRQLVAAAIAANLLVAVGLAAIPFYRSWSNGPIPEPPSPEPSSVAQVSGTAETQWSDDAAPNDDGSVPANRRLFLRRGLARIVFQSGAAAILQGPAVLEPQSAESALLVQGAMVAHVPAAASGFVIRTPSAAVIDLGTEFGVRVQPGGLSEVEVFVGNVEVAAAIESQEEGPRRALRAGEALRISPSVAGALPRMERMAAGGAPFVRSLVAAATRLETLVAAEKELLHHYTFAGPTPAEKCRDRRGDLHLQEVAMSGDSGGGRIDYSSLGSDPSVQAMHPFRAASMGNSQGMGLQSQVSFRPPQTMTVELLLQYAGSGNAEGEAGMIAAALATRENPLRCGFLIGAVDDGRLVQMLDGGGPWLESGFQFQAGRWYYVASTFRVDGGQTVVNTYVADLARGPHALEWVVKDTTVSGVPASSRLGVGHGFDGEAGRAYPWPGALGQVAIYGAVLDRDILQSHLDAAVKESLASESAPRK